MNGLDLFSGGGGFTDGLREWVRPIAYCEIHPYCQHLLLSRMERGEIPRAPVWDDVKTFGRHLVDEPVDIVYGGFPCQDISVAGRGAGLGGERSGLFHEFARVVEELEPPLAFIENVPAIRTRGLNRVVCRLSQLGFDLRWTIVSAQELGAPHVRRRFFLLAAHPDRLGLRELHRRSGGQIRTNKTLALLHGQDRDAPHPLRERGGEGRTWQEVWRRIAYAVGPVGADQWPGDVAQPGLRRGDDGLAHRVERLRVLGNGVVPACAQGAFMRLVGITKEKKDG